MKPIPGWMLVSKRTGKPKESAGAAGLALIYFDAEVARDSRFPSERVIEVEIRERPKPRRAAKLSLSEIHQRAHDAVFGDGLPEVPPKPRRAAGKGRK